jgi:hypothetical protein
MFGVGARSNARAGRADRGAVDRHSSARRRIGLDRLSGYRRSGRRRGTVPAWVHVRATRREAVR